MYKILAVDDGELFLNQLKGLKIWETEKILK